MLIMNATGYEELIKFNLTIEFPAKLLMFNSVKT